MCKCELWLSVCNETTWGVILSLPPLPLGCPSTAMSGCSRGFPALEESYLDVINTYPYHSWERSEKQQADIL